MTEALRQAAENAADVLDEARTYVGCESWSPSMLEECERALRMLRAALAQPPAPTAPELEKARWEGVQSVQIQVAAIVLAALELLEAAGDNFPPEKLVAFRRVFGDAKPVQQPGAEPNIIYSPIATKPQTDGRHPNDNEPVDPDRSHWLTMRGDDEGQGLDPYWKWGHAAGWNDHKKAAPAQRQPLTQDEILDMAEGVCPCSFTTCWNLPAPSKPPTGSPLPRQRRRERSCEH